MRLERGKKGGREKEYGGGGEWRDENPSELPLLYVNSLLGLWV